jgi:hypothetical protein
MRADTLRLRTLRAAGFESAANGLRSTSRSLRHASVCNSRMSAGQVPANGYFEIDSKFFRRRHTYSWQREPFQGLRKFRTTVMQRFAAAKKPVQRKPRWQAFFCLEYSRGVEGNLGKWKIALGKWLVTRFYRPSLLTFAAPARNYRAERKHWVMAEIGFRQVVGLALLALSAWAQPVKTKNLTAVPPIALEQPDALRTRDELSQLLNRYPPALKGVLGLDPTLLSNQAYLAPYPGLSDFLSAHPEIARNPSFYVGANMFDMPAPGPRAERVLEGVLGGLAGLTGFAMAIGLLVWVIRTLVDYRRWNRLTKVQTDVHTKLVDRFTSNEDLLAYVQSPAGSKFLESSPISLDAGPRSVGAPLGRILWSVQAGLVLTALGIGLEMEVGRVSSDAAEPLHVLGVLGIALGLGFVVSAIISFGIAYRLGLIGIPSGKE